MKTPRLAILASAILFSGSLVSGDELPENRPAGNGDVNGDGAINITDAIYLLNWSFRGGPEPVAIPTLSLAPTEAELDPTRHWDATFSQDFYQNDCHFVTEGEHPFFVLEPGYHVALAGEEDGTPMRVEITVLDELELVGGVMTRVVEEREWENGQITEISRNFLAICEESGDLYYFGEDFEETNDGENEEGWGDEEPWRAGVDGARAGVLLPGSPIVGSRYFNEIAPNVAMDRAEVIEIAESVTVGSEVFEQVLVVYETSGMDLEEEAIKYYARGVGIIKDSTLEVVAYGFVGGSDQDQEFENLSIALEFNETDQDAEIVLWADASEGLRRLSVFSPTGEKIVELRSSDWREGAEPVGLSEFAVESGEPSVEGVKDAFPEGTYRVEGTGVTGERFGGEAVLSHTILPAPLFSTPELNGAAPPAATFSWAPVDGAVAYEVEIENEDLGFDLAATLPDGATCFEIPSCLLIPHMEYRIGVGSVSPEGNVSVAEILFVTTGF